MYYYFDGAEEIFGRSLKEAKVVSKGKKEKILEWANVFHTSLDIAKSAYLECEFYGKLGIEVNPKEIIESKINSARIYGD